MATLATVASVFCILAAAAALEFHPFCRAQPGKEEVCSPAKAVSCVHFLEKMN
jgi:hypothetical protein